MRDIKVYHKNGEKLFFLLSDNTPIDVRGKADNTISNYWKIVSTKILFKTKPSAEV